MTTEVEIGWQSEKTVLQCNRYMLDKEIAMDVLFEVGPPEGATVNIRAHKYMLISRSPVFEAMFSNEKMETKYESEAKIRIVDIDADVFRLLLGFIYCNSVSMDLTLAPALLYAAKKYLLSGLTQSCLAYLQGILNTKNVCETLELSFTFDAKDLKSQCLRFIGDHSETVLNGNELLNVPRQSLEAILKMDRAMSGPSTFFHSCIKWAKHQLKNQSVEAPTDLQVRETLGSLLYEIPFPTISSTEFASLVEESDLLTAEERSAIYDYLASRKEKDNLQFSTVNRHEQLVNRATKTVKGLWPGSECPSCGRVKLSCDKINFKTDKSILLTGLGLYTGHNRSQYSVDILIIQNQVFLMQKKFTVPYVEDSKVFKVAFDEPITITPEQNYRIICLSYQAIGYFSEACDQSVTVGNVTFTSSCVLPKLSNIYRCDKCGYLSHTLKFGACNGCGAEKWRQIHMDENFGQIPQLYFISAF